MEAHSDEADVLIVLYGSAHEHPLTVMSRCVQVHSVNTEIKIHSCHNVSRDFSFFFNLNF